MVLDHWYWRCENPDTTIVLPDGCRDLICLQADGMAPVWRVSPLFDRATATAVDTSATLQGWRLSPGTCVNIDALLSALGTRHPDEIDTAALLSEMSRFDETTQAALEALSQPHSPPIDRIARDLGVSIRTLQRELQRSTGRSPGYWRSLVRARGCARAIVAGKPLIEAAADAGYADQSHMTRECQRWFGVAPGAFKRRQLLAQRIYDSGIGD